MIGLAAPHASLSGEDLIRRVRIGSITQSSYSTVELLQGSVIICWKVPKDIHTDSAVELLVFSEHAGVQWKIAE